MTLFNELPTAFPWYDNIGKQQRFRENAKKMCDYKLISPNTGLLPFQFKISFQDDKNIFAKNNGEFFIDDSTISNGTFTASETHVRTPFINVTPEETLFIRTGQVFGTPGSFFDENYIHVSDLPSLPTTASFVVPANARYVSLNVSADPARREYDKRVFALTRNEAPEQFSPGNIISWKIITCCGTEIDVSNNIPLISKSMFSDGFRYFYAGDPLLFSANTPLDLPDGNYYSYIEFDRGDKMYSEVFTSQKDRSPYMMIEFWNSCDIDPLVYSNGWKQRMYIDSFIHASEPEVEEDGERDGNDMLIPTFQRMITRYRFSAIVPDYMKIALVSLQLHDNILITTEKGTRTGKVDRLSTSTSIEDNGAYSTTDVIIDQYVMVKKACCSNIEFIDMA